MKVAIFETEHHEVAYPIIKLFDNGKNEITVFSYPEIIEDLNHLLPYRKNDYNWIIKRKTQSRISFIYKIYRESKKRKIQLLYLDTISDNFIFYAIMVLLLRHVRVIVTIHSINNWFDHKFSLSIRRLIRTVGKKMLIRVVTEFNVLYIPSVEHLKQKLNAKKKVHCIPGAIYEQEHAQQEQPPLSEKINIVIPGSVEKRRREYSYAFELAKKLTSIKIPCHIFFLGKLTGEYGREIKKASDEINKSGDIISYYKTPYVNQEKFDKVMSEATIVFMPLKLQTVFADDIEEVYGTSSASGSISDVIRHAKPFVIPKALRIDPVLEPGCFRYSSIDDIVKFISQIHQQQEIYTDLSKKARKASEHFTIENIRSSNKEVFH